MTTVSDAEGVPPRGDSDHDEGQGRGQGEGRGAPAPGVVDPPEDPPEDPAGNPPENPAGNADDGPGATVAKAQGSGAEPAQGIAARMRERARAGIGAAPGVAWTLTKGTAAGAFRYRVTGLAAEAAFFALLSLPPLVIGLIGTMGHLRGMFQPGTVTEIRTWVIDQARTVLTGPAVDTVVVPLLDDVIRGGSPDIVSLSFLLSLWAGSRATNVYIDTISIAYGLSGIRGVIRTRLRAFFLYLIGLLVFLIVIPLLVAGPALVQQALPESAGLVQALYWPVVVTLSIVFLATLYHLSVPVRTPWRRDLPGAVLALLIWIVGSFGLRIFLAGSLSGVSVYGSLSAAIAVLAWLYVAALAVLIGAALNAEIDRLWPTADTARARAVRDARGDEPEPGEDTE
ncbi:YihY/virulence factor BrkB family protein [Actinomadura sp. 7K534]|uniref:YihY/virulence factor BrkB family protein n=1 Tax=Actinomadura sp. 7K534 TaxID=2530366 RepID=UPI001FB6241F|nr:YihY/virulence factor BrkB family protein [Actinomadura sp. 7K534]